MKIALRLPVLLLLLVVFAALPGRGLMEIRAVSRNDARALGLDVRTQPAGPDDLWVELQFKTEGAFKDFGPGRFSRVELRFFEGTNLAFNAPLQFRPAPPGQVLVGFQVRRALADRVTLMVVIGSGLIPGGGFELRLKDFLVGGSDGQAPDKAR